MAGVPRVRRAVQAKAEREGTPRRAGADLQAEIARKLRLKSPDGELSARFARLRREPQVAEVTLLQDLGDDVSRAPGRIVLVHISGQHPVERAFPFGIDPVRRRAKVNIEERFAKTGARRDHH